MKTFLFKQNILSPCLFNLYAEYIMQNARLDDSQAGIKITRRNSNNFRYADDTTLMAESEEELRSLFEEGERGEQKKTDIKLNIQKTKIIASDPNTSWQIEGGKWKQWQILFSWAPKSLWMVIVAMKLKDSCSLEGKLWQS